MKFLIVFALVFSLQTINGQLVQQVQQQVHQQQGAIAAGQKVEVQQHQNVVHKPQTHNQIHQQKPISSGMKHIKPVVKPQVGGQVQQHQNVVHNSQAQQVQLQVHQKGPIVAGEHPNKQQVAGQKVDVQQHQNVEHNSQQVVNKDVPQVQPIVAPLTPQKPVVSSSQHIVPVQIKHRMMRSLKMGQQPYKVEDIPGRCNFNCDQLNPTVCGFNGLCHREFENQCELNTYNCVNTQKIFHIVDDGSCIDETTVKCYQGDM